MSITGIIDTELFPKWKPMTGKEHAEGFYRISKGIDDKNPRWSNDDRGWNWVGLLWLPADEFSMPEVPKPTIEPCPFCGGACVSTQIPTDTRWFIRCCDDYNCRYVSALCETEQEAIDLHNTLCRRSK